MDPYKLGVLCVFIACLMYWIYLLIIFTKDRNKPRSKNIRFVRNPKDGAIYLVEGKKVCSHIPDMPTLNYLRSYFGFITDTEEMPIDEIKRRFTIRADKPTITKYFPKTDK